MSEDKPDSSGRRPRPSSRRADDAPLIQLDSLEVIQRGMRHEESPAGVLYEIMKGKPEVVELLRPFAREAVEALSPDEAEEVRASEDDDLLDQCFEWGQALTDRVLEANVVRLPEPPRIQFEKHAVSATLMFLCREEFCRRWGEPEDQRDWILAESKHPEGWKEIGSGDPCDQIEFYGDWYVCTHICGLLQDSKYYELDTEAVTALVDRPEFATVAPALKSAWRSGNAPIYLWSALPELDAIDINRWEIIEGMEWQYEFLVRKDQEKTLLGEFEAFHDELVKLAKNYPY